VRSHAKIVLVISTFFSPLSLDTQVAGRTKGIFTFFSFFFNLTSIPTPSSLNLVNARWLTNQEEARNASMKKTGQSCKSLRNIETFLYRSLTKVTANMGQASFTSRHLARQLRYTRISSSPM
jgi:hypothetical protein